MLLEFKGIQSKVINKAKEKALLGAEGKEGVIGLLNGPIDGQGHGGPRVRAEEGSWGWMVGIPSGGAGKASAPGGLIHVPSKLSPCYENNGRRHAGSWGNLEGVSAWFFPWAAPTEGKKRKGCSPPCLAPLRLPPTAPSASLAAKLSSALALGASHVME